ncbi:AAA family ATPase [Marinobacter salarius]|uniref:AAA family ATPase n=1 Tax=Marinobacter salarius TaxID=1420917 RepID=UPI0018F16E10|nr:AAA family ATPase [Marinobacter salarius]MBJ7277446.1 AAA family ATPase [Marinobacter salarius]
MSKIILESLLVFSLDSENGFYTEFSESVNIVHGRNTSGKSTLIQSIIYSLGINDSKENLKDINEQNVFFRLDCKVLSKGEIYRLVFVRSGDTLVLQKEDEKPNRFDGIDSNNSYEYARYKSFISEILGFDLILQKRSELVSAPLEAAVLPYYISQSVGWVYIRESIGDYRFYRNFKYDYLDYYCGIDNGRDRIRKYNLEEERTALRFEIKQIDDYEYRNEGLKVSKILDDRFKGKAEIFLEEFQNVNSVLLIKEYEHTKLCNKISMLKGRQKVLTQVIANIKNQVPRVDQCPTCDQKLPGDLKEFYNYRQDVNDAQKEKDRIKNDIKANVSKINSVESKIFELNDKLSRDFRVLKKLSEGGITFDSWLDHNANLKIMENLSSKRKIHEEKINEIDREIEDLGGDLDVELLRKRKERYFLSVFKKKAEALGVEVPREGKYQDLYSINSFPYQGVELHKLLIAYNFSFYEMVLQNPEIHSFPFLLDAIFKEDIEIETRNEIFKFLSEEQKNSGQIIFSVAEYKGESTSVDPMFDVNSVKDVYFPSDTKLICIGDSKTKRAFLSNSCVIDAELITDTLNLLEVI